LKRDILRDSRHGEVTTLIEGSAPERRFGDWSLAYAGPSHLVAKIVDKAAQDAATAPDRGAEDVLRLLASFSPIA
jgi:hypothetical protein